MRDNEEFVLNEKVRGWSFLWEPLVVRSGKLEGSRV